MEELRALDQRILDSDVEHPSALELLLEERGRKLKQLVSSDSDLSHWLELESSGGEIQDKLDAFRLQMSRNLQASEQELRRLAAFQQQEDGSREVEIPDARLIDRMG